MDTLLRLNWYFKAYGYYMNFSQISFEKLAWSYWEGKNSSNSNLTFNQKFLWGKKMRMFKRWFAELLIVNHGEKEMMRNSSVSKWAWELENRNLDLKPAFSS